MPAVCGGQYNVIARDHGDHRIAYRLDNAGSLVTEDGGQRRRIDPVSNEYVRVADSGRHHTDPDFIGPQGVQLKLFHCEKVSRARARPLQLSAWETPHNYCRDEDAPRRG